MLKLTKVFNNGLEQDINELRQVFSKAVADSLFLLDSNLRIHMVIIKDCTVGTIWEVTRDCDLWKALNDRYAQKQWRNALKRGVDLERFYAKRRQRFR